MKRIILIIVFLISSLFNNLKIAHAQDPKSFKENIFYPLLWVGELSTFPVV